MQQQKISQSSHWVRWSPSKSVLWTTTQGDRSVRGVLTRVPDALLTAISRSGSERQN
jgi:hypothetical protein